jgi:hypothetical protein
MGTVYENQYTFVIISRCIIFRIRSVSYKSCRENQNTHFVFGNFLPKIVPFMRRGKIWYSNRQLRDDNIKQRMCTACWVAQATGTHSEFVTLTAFPRQQWLCERASLLRCTHFACPVNFHFVTSVCGRQLWIVCVSEVAVQRFGCHSACLGLLVALRTVWCDTQHHVLVSWTQGSLLTVTHTPTRTHARTTHIHAFLTQGCYKHMVLLCGLSCNTDLIYAPRFVLLWPWRKPLESSEVFYVLFLWDSF